jgi:hypothetical protein
MPEPTWVKSSSSSSGNCVEAAQVPDGVLVRDSKDPNGPILRFTEAEWQAFVDGAKDYEFDF